ncbi:MAG: hypothetical protein AMJ79_03800 [Phycisphaerae bacterium SM23_30]|nr:MAG: hypothetical protein AMJ79_03800 [Phycisphaerae bacterium SM23_30]
MPPKPRRGRPPTFVKNPDGKPIVGLSKDSNGYYYSFWRSEGLKKRPNFGPLWDYEGAISRFGNWLLKRNNAVMKLEIREDLDEEITSLDEYIERKTYTKEETDFLNKLRRDAGQPEYDYPIGEEKKWQTIYDIELDESFFWQKFRTLLLTELDKVKEKTGLNIFIKDPPAPSDNIDLSTLLEFYLSHANPCDAEARGCKNACDYFIKIIGKKYINDISEEDIIKYYNNCFSLLSSGEESADWVSKKFRRVKTILKRSSDYYPKAKYEAKRIYSYCSILKQPTVTEPEPKAVTRKDFHAFLNATKEDKHKLYLLLMYNCGYYAADICDLRKRNIYIKDRRTYFVMRRDKTKRKFKRVNALFSETTKLLNEYIENNPEIDDDMILFRNSKGKPETAKSIESYFNRLRERIVDTLEKQETSIIWFRKACASILHLKVDNDLIKLTLGQKIGHGGDTYRYIEINPEPTIKVAEILHKEYFE